MEKTVYEQLVKDLTDHIEDRRSFLIESLVQGVPEDYPKYQYLVGSLRELEILQAELKRVLNEYFPNVKLWR